MADMRNYKETIKAAIAKEREADANWSWRLSRLNSKIAEIGWGYLDYIGSIDKFEIEIEDGDDLKCVIGTMPDETKFYIFIGQTRWDDAKTYEDGITKVIHAMAENAHSTY
jgi:hypothetical protein